MADVRVIDLRTAPGFAPAPDVVGRALFGDQAMVVLVTFKPGAPVPPHSHEQEQFGVVLVGSLMLTADGVTHTLGPGKAYHVPARVEHSAIAGPDGSIGLEVFSPLREDYLRAAEHFEAPQSVSEAK